MSPEDDDAGDAEGVTYGLTELQQVQWRGDNYLEIQSTLETWDTASNLLVEGSVASAECKKHFLTWCPTPRSLLNQSLPKALPKRRGLQEHG